jgi:N4-gp56 family major capsid protein
MPNTVTSKSAATLVDQYSTFFSKQLLSYATQLLRKYEFGQKAPLPKKSGNLSIRWFKWGVPGTVSGLSASTVANSMAALTEGTKPAGDRVLTQSYIETDLIQYGMTIKMTDVLRMTELFDSLKQATKTIAEDGALHCDSLVRNELKSGLTAKRTADGGAYNQLVATDVVTTVNLLDCVTNLKLNRAPEVNGGGYVMLASPAVTRDLLKDTTWVNAASYSNVKALYNGEVGTFYGIRIIEDTNPWRSAAASETVYDPTATGIIYTSFVLGGEAFGVPELSGESPYSSKVIINDKPDKSDPLNQNTIVGIKNFWATKVLQPTWGVQFASGTQYA